MPVVVQMTSDEARLLRGIQRVEGGLEKMQAKLKDVQRESRRTGQGFERTGRKADQAFDPRKIGRFTAGLVGAGSVAAAFTTLINLQDRLATNMRRIGDEARKASNDIVSFASIQEQGNRAAAVKVASNLATSFGITDRAEAFTTIQALQSRRGGSLEAGVRASQSVFAATQLGVPIAQAREAEVLGASLGLQEGELIRKLVIAGEQSARDPAALTRAPAGLKFFGAETDFGIASAATLAGAAPVEQLPTLVKAAGIALSGESKLAGTFARLGVADGTREERLRALAGAGITTPEQLSAAGLKEIRQQEAISALVTNLSEIDRIGGAVTEQAKPGVLVQRRAEVEAELPNLRLQREIAILTARQADARAFGAEGTRALTVERQERIRALALEERGQSFFVGDDERAGRFAGGLGALFDVPGARNEQGQLVGNLGDSIRRIEQSLNSIDQNTGAGGGPTLVNEPFADR